MYGEERKTQQKENISNEKWFFSVFFFINPNLKVKMSVHTAQVHLVKFKLEQM